MRSGTIALLQRFSIRMMATSQAMTRTDLPARAKASHPCGAMLTARLLRRLDDHAFETRGELGADLAAFTLDVLGEDQAQGVEMGLDHTKIGIGERPLLARKGAKRVPDPCHQRITEGAALALDVVRDAVEFLDGARALLRNFSRRLQVGDAAVEIDERAWRVGLGEI